MILRTFVIAALLFVGTMQPAAPICYYDSQLKLWICHVGGGPPCQ